MTDDRTPFHEVLGLDLHKRSRKPRRQGITMVIDTGYNCAMVESVLALYGHLVDIAKITELHLTAPVAEIRRKVQLYREAGVGVQPGGVVVELARLQHRERQVLDRLAELGFDHIEVSSSSTTQREAVAERAFVDEVRRSGFTPSG